MGPRMKSVVSPLGFCSQFLVESEARPARLTRHIRLFDMDNGLYVNVSASLRWGREKFACRFLSEQAFGQRGSPSRKIGCDLVGKDATTCPCLHDIKSCCPALLESSFSFVLNVANQAGDLDPCDVSRVAAPVVLKEVGPETFFESLAAVHTHPEVTTHRLRRALWTREVQHFDTVRRKLGFPERRDVTKTYGGVPGFQLIKKER